MTQDEIIEMARQAGFEDFDRWAEHYPQETKRWCERMEAFAKLVRNHYSYTHAHLWLTRIEGAVKAEREACAKLCEAVSTDAMGYGCARLIRARAKADRGEA